MPKAGSSKVTAAALKAANDLFPEELNLLKKIARGQAYGINRRNEMSENGLSDAGILHGGITKWGHQVIAALKQQGKWGK